MPFLPLENDIFSLLLSGNFWIMLSNLLKQHLTAFCMLATKGLFHVFMKHLRSEKKKV